MAAASTAGGSAGDGPWDPGLQPERTALAWQRTGLASCLASLVALRDGIAATAPAVTAFAVLALAAALTVVVRSRAELPRRVRALRAGEPLPAPAAVPAALLCLLALAAATIGILLHGWG